MEETDSLTAFFYNIVPGSLFILVVQQLLDFSVIKKITPLEWHQHWETQIFFIISLGLLVGFTFQGITKLFRQISWKFLSDRREKLPLLLRRIFQIILPFSLNEEIWREIVGGKDNSFLYEKSLKTLNIILKQKKSKEKIQGSEYRKSFYLMYNYLLAEGKDKQPTAYTSRLAFWANTYFGSLALLFIRIFFSHESLPWVIFLILGVISGFLFLEYLRSMYDSVLKTFVSVVNIDKKEQGLKRGKK